MKFFTVFIVALLSACAAPQLRISPPDAILWQQHQQQVNRIHQWDIKGRVAFRTEKNGGHADFFWQQSDEQHYEIKLVAPFGGGTVRIQSQSDAVSLTTSDGEILVEQNIDALLSQIDVLNFPVTGLRYWLRGVPAPQSDARLLSWNEQGYLYMLEQDGWKIEMRNYTNVASYQLPRKIFLRRINNQNIDVRLVIGQWGMR